MRVLLLGHGRTLSDIPRCLPFRTLEEWDAIKRGSEVVMVDIEPEWEPDMVMDVSKSWSVPEPVDVIVDAMGHVAARFVQTADFYRSSFHALVPGGKLHLWVSKDTTLVAEKGATQFRVLKIDGPDPKRPPSRRIPLEMVHYLWLTKLAISPSAKHLPNVRCRIVGDGTSYFTIECVAPLTTKDPDAQPTEYLWQLTDVNSTIVKSVGLVNSCDNGDEKMHVSKAVRDFNGKFSFESPKRVYEGVPFAGDFNSYVVFRVEVIEPKAVCKWTAEYSDFATPVDVFEMSEEDAKAP